MALSKYISAEWISVEPDLAIYVIKAIGDDSSVCIIPSEDCDVPPWPEYLAEGGVITGTPPPVKET